ncbi:MAG: YjbH domain-containing protein [Armatimonadetes bacterium]|nr:YjbH domain-containing protein [Armatimonadota bacterium]
MKNSFLVLAIGSLLVCAYLGIASAAPSFFSTSGNILTPDDTLLSTGGFSANYHAIEIEDTDQTQTIIGANVGVTPSLELGVARVDFDNGNEETIINGKYLLFPETAVRPSLVLGVLDLGGELDPDDDPGIYVLLGKNLTPMASDIAGEPSKPLRGVIGFGTGYFDGLFGALDWTISQRMSLMAEYIDTGDAQFNVGIRFALTDTLRGDVALIDGDDLGFGISFTKMGL